ncbi:unnamed protein product, partial [Trichobilharzia szidati]
MNLCILLLTVSILFFANVNCRRHSATPTEICNLPLNIGRGLEKKSRYYYNKATNQCSAFAYKGLSGNANRFRTKDECERMCVKPNLSRVPSNGDRRPTLPVRYPADRRPIQNDRDYDNRYPTRAPSRERTREPTTRIVYIT